MNEYNIDPLTIPILIDVRILVNKKECSTTTYVKSQENSLDVPRDASAISAPYEQIKKRTYRINPKKQERDNLIEADIMKGEYTTDEIAKRQRVTQGIVNSVRRKMRLNGIEYPGRFRRPARRPATR